MHLKLAYIANIGNDQADADHVELDTDSDTFFWEASTKLEGQFLKPLKIIWKRNDLLAWKAEQHFRHPPT